MQGLHPFSNGPDHTSVHQLCTERIFQVEQLADGMAATCCLSAPQLTLASDCRLTSRSSHKSAPGAPAWYLVCL
jgi:hypothetical protein